MNRKKFVSHLHETELWVFQKKEITSLINELFELTKTHTGIVFLKSKTEISLIKSKFTHLGLFSKKK